MSYQKTIWNNGGPPGISAQALNNLETQYDLAKNDLNLHKNESLLNQPPHGLPKYNLSATTNPTNTNDSTQGYSIGSVWVNKSTLIEQSFICLNASVDSAKWERFAGDQRVRFYLDGTEFVNIVEGFSQGTGSQSKELTHLFLRGIGGSPTGIRTYVTDLAINLTPISKIKIEWDNISNIGGDNVKSVLIASTNKTGSPTIHNANYTRLDAFSRRVDELNVANLQGDHFIRVHAWADFINASYHSTVRVYRIWGEL